MQSDDTAGAISAVHSQALLERAEQAWHAGDMQSLIDMLDPAVQIETNFNAPILGIAAAGRWLTGRSRTQLGYRLSKQLRGRYDNTVVCRWTGFWREPDGLQYQVTGIELLTIGSRGLITHWEAVMHQERIDEH